MSAMTAATTKGSTKACGRCRALKGEAEFTESQWGRNGGWCKACVRDYNGEHAAKNAPTPPSSATPTPIASGWRGLRIDAEGTSWKRCDRCGQEKALGEFTREQWIKAGGWCKSCLGEESHILSPATSVATQQTTAMPDSVATSTDAPVIWEVWQRALPVSDAKPEIAFAKEGIGINKAAWSALGFARRVEVLVNRERGLIGLRATDETNREGRSITGRRISCRGLIRALKPTGRYTATLVNGVLVCEALKSAE